MGVSVSMEESLLTIRFRRAMLFSMALLVGMGACVDLEQGKRAHHAEDYATALRHLRPAAASGDPEAQYYLRAMYFYWKGVPQDRGEAFNLRGQKEQCHEACKRDK